MPQNKESAEKEAQEKGFPKSNVICLDGDEKCYIAPHGITTHSAKLAYAKAREDGHDAEYSAKIAHKVQDEHDAKQRNLKPDSNEALYFTRNSIKAETVRNEQTNEKTYQSRGYAVLFNDPTFIQTRNGTIEEIVLPSAFDDVDFTGVPLLWNHDTSQILGWEGVNMRVEKDENGIRWHLDHYQNPIEKDRHDKMSSGKMGCSFGFNCEYEDRDDGKRYITRITNLAELSVCAFPAYKNTIALARTEPIEIEIVEPVVDEAIEREEKLLAEFMKKIKGER